MDIIVSFIFFSTIIVIILNFFVVLFAKDNNRFFIQPKAEQQNNELDRTQPPREQNGLQPKQGNNNELDDKDITLVNDAMTMITHNYHNAYLTVEKIADELGTSKRNLQRKFKSVKGTSPSKELKRIRIENALDALNRGEQIKQVGFDAGFSSQSYFCKCFKETIGVTPSDFVKREFDIQAH